MKLNVTPPGDSGFSDLTTEQDLFGGIMTWSIGIVGIVCVLVIIFAAIKIMTATDPESRKKGYMMLVFALVALAIIILAIAIVNSAGGSIMKIFP